MASRSGWDEISPLFTWLATRFTGGTDLEVELLATGVSGDLAYTVAYERSMVSVHDEPLQPNTLRVTQVYRREDGDWKLIHRHGDGPLSTRDRPARHHVDVTVIGLRRVRCADLRSRGVAATVRPTTPTEGERCCELRIRRATRPDRPCALPT